MWRGHSARRSMKGEPLIAALDLPVGIMTTEPDNSDSIATETARIAGDILAAARIVVAMRRERVGKPIKLTDYLNGLLRGPVARDRAEEDRLLRERRRK